MIIADLVRRGCRAHADRTLVVEGDRSLTYAEVWERSVRLVNALRTLGLNAGDRIATLGPNALTSVEEMTALAIGGYARTALHGMNLGDAHRHMLTVSGARAVITHPDIYAKFADVFSTLPGLEAVLVHGEFDPPWVDERARSYEGLLADASSTDARVPVSPDDIVHLAFSSGSSGYPKASVHTQSSWMAVTTDHLTMLPRLTARDIYLAAAPLSHAASTVIYGLLARGAAIEVMPHFDAGEALALIEGKHCTLTLMVPTMLQLLVNHPDAQTRDLRSLRALVYAGAPISVETARAAQAVLGDVLFQTYGQSECLPATVLTPEDHAQGVAGDARLLRSAGRPCLNSTVRILGADDRPLPDGEIGEIAVGSRGRMRGIFDDPDATARRLTDDGLVRTADVGYLDSRGYLFVVDRLDDMIISGGFNVWPAEVELALTQHPDVREAVVVGVSHAKWGESISAVVVVGPDSTVTERALIDFCRERIGSLKKPNTVVLRTEPLPRGGLGKISRREIRDLYWPSSTDPDRSISGA
jgi:acyl-CoA synthetase (AMP-forming)/AMP-acid ligase II